MVLKIEDVRPAVIGLGYVGLPLAVELSGKFSTIGFDVLENRIEELRRGVDRTLEVEPERLSAAGNLEFSSHPDDLRKANVFIVTVPTPIDQAKRPDLRPMLAATRTVASALKVGDLVIYESTVYPGATEDICARELERLTGLRFNQDFFCGYSPERINPGDKVHRLTTIVKVTSGSTPEAARLVDAIYASIVPAGTHQARSIQVAEAAKVIENTQRDVNIALVNELALIFGRMGIDTLEVLEAAGTKWNFLNFRPGLVGGHCIGVDPYYLTHRAQEIGYHPEVILAGRRINDSMGAHVATEVLKLMAKAGRPLNGGRALILGLAFKENCPDLRNSRVIDIVEALRDYRVEVDVHDPWVNPEEANREYGIKLVQRPQFGSYDAIILAVAHKEFLENGGEGVRAFGGEQCVIYDVKSVLPRTLSHKRL